MFNDARRKTRVRRVVEDSHLDFGFGRSVYKVTSLTVECHTVARCSLTGGGYFWAKGQNKKY